ncbi:hypothetical protein MKA58_09280 [[Clostridium] innocuum]|nr:hypothetical protein [[Clostridium] innocuum]
MIDMYKWVDGYDPYRRTPDNYYDEVVSDDESADQQAEVEEEERKETAVERYIRSTEEVF